MRMWSTIDDTPFASATSTTEQPVPGADAMLNPHLYSLLVRRFGRVLVSNKGEPMVVRTEIFNNRPSPTIIRPGETYRVCCPSCGDSKFHLSIAHAFGTVHERTGQRVFYARCQRCVLAGKALFDLLGAEHDLGHATVSPAPSGQAPADGDRYVTPGQCYPLSQRCQETEQARQYLANRGIDPDEVARVYGWRVCVWGNGELWRGSCQGRIVVPVTRDGREVGWQARLVGDPPPELKDKTWRTTRWYSMPGTGWRARNFIGFDQARTSKSVVMVEGPTDMARQGPPCVGSLGQVLSSHQYDLIASTWGDSPDKTIIIVGDAGSKETQVTDRHVQQLLKRSVRAAIYNPRLPHGDPGSWGRDEFTAFVVDHVKNTPRGVRAAGQTLWSPACP